MEGIAEEKRGLESEGRKRECELEREQQESSYLRKSRGDDG